MADKNEFLAQDELITIIPNFKRENPLHLLSGDFGPFEPLTPISVPLWLALTLKKRKNCKIQIPVWMYADRLRLVLEAEERGDKLTQLPFYYMEIASLLLHNAAEDVPDAPTVRSLLEDIWTRRNVKLRESLQAINPNTLGVKVTNISSMEIFQVRDISIATLNKFVSMKGNSSFQS